MSPAGSWRRRRAAAAALDRLPLEAMQAVDKRIGKDVFAVLSVEASVSSRVSQGERRRRTCGARLPGGSRSWAKHPNNPRLRGQAGGFEAPRKAPGRHRLAASVRSDPGPT